MANLVNNSNKTAGIGDFHPTSPNIVQSFKFRALEISLSLSVVLVLLIETKNKKMCLIQT